MITSRFSWRKTASLLLLAGAAVSATAAYANPPQEAGLLHSLPGKAKGRLPDNAISAHSLSVQVNRGRLRSGRFSVSLPDGISLDAVRDSQRDMGNGQFAWVGHANGDKSNRVIIGVSGDAVAASFTYKDRLFKLEPRPDGSSVVSEVEPGDPAPELDPIPVADTTGPALPTSADAQAAADGGAVIDVLVAYTPRVQSLYGSQGAEALIIQAVAETNQAYANSGITARLNLVRAVLTNYTESGNMETDLIRLSGTSDGYMDELHSLRNTYGADLVSLLENEPQYCGIAYLMSYLSPGFASSAFSVVHHSCATGYYSFAHELGHNQGANHDPANANGAMYPYAYGYQDPSRLFRTVMAYNCSGGCPRVDNFSNPGVSRNGRPTGIVGYADNALALNNTAATVASFRQLQAQLPPSAPGGLQATASSDSAIELSWVDTSPDESGFRLERSDDGLGFTEIASLPANTRGYLDENLVADTLYTYRVRSWNSAGNSAFSDTAVAATRAAESFTDQRASADLPAAGSVNGTYRDTWENDGTYQAIGEILSQGRRTSSRYAYLEHKWAFDIQGGNSLTLFASTRTDATADSFTFSYSTDNILYTDMFTITDASPQAQQFALPPGLSGRVYVRVRDNVRQAGVSSAYSVQVDQLLIRTESGAAMPVPGAPTGLSATVAGPYQVDLDWTDTSDNEYGFSIERRIEGATQWVQAGTTGANTTSFTDSGLVPATSYQYRVSAFNGAGPSAASNTSTARTDAEPAVVANIQLSAVGYTSRRKQKADLSWSGAQGNTVDIYRDGARIAPSAANSGRYTDDIGNGRSTSYVYEVCETNSTTCSNTATAAF